MRRSEFDKNLETAASDNFQSIPKRDVPPEIKNFRYPFGMSFHVFNYFLLGFSAHASILYYFLYLIPFRLVSIWTFPVGAVLGFLTSGLGVTIGAHRYWTHRCFKATKPLQYLLMLMHTSAFQEPLFIWCRNHRIHHKYTDTDADPHSATKGFWFSHITWLFQAKHPKVLEAEKIIDISDLAWDPVVRFQARHYFKLVILTAFLFPMGLFYLLYPEMSLFHNYVCAWVQMGMGCHVTFLVNSVAHIWGNKPYDKYISPTDSQPLAFFTLGEGWHNYHHTFPWDYKASEFGGTTFNLSAGVIHFFAWIGWAYDLKTVSHKLLVDRINRTGDVSHPLHKHHHHASKGDKSDEIEENANEAEDIKAARACWGWGDKELNQADVEVTETLFPLKKSF